MVSRFTFFASTLLLLIATALSGQSTFQITKTELKNKIKGGWAGQTIGVTFGAPVEFRFNGTLINDYRKLEWNAGLLKKTMVDNPGVYDDLYMDLTFVEVFEREGLDAPVASHANAFANAGYMLWHANQAARYNILNGIAPPASGHWTHNPHADCIDYQIESDFAGLMSPGMPNAAADISDKIGHIMNYGDGWYGGVMMGSMYALAFTSKDVRYVVSEALKTIPADTRYHQCIADVLRWHQQYPNDWKQTWFEIQKKWTDDTGCPDGVFEPFNIDATVNSAYVVLGLLYGNGDFTKTMEITTRCGQDADCNPSSAGGILGVMLGYDAIPAYWKMGLQDIEDLPFKYTNTSLNRVYEIGTKQALLNVERNGGVVKGEYVVIRQQAPKAVRREQCFEGHYPTEKRWIGQNLGATFELDFTGNGFVLRGEAKTTPGNKSATDAVVEVAVYLDDKKMETVKLPVNFTTRRHEITWRYQLTEGPHRLRLQVLRPDDKARVYLSDLITYTSKPPTPHE